MWEVKTFRETGSRHRRNGLKCQDSVYSIQKGNVLVVSLADGSGSTDMASLGADTATKAVARLLSEHFDELYEMEQENIRYSTIVEIREDLYDICSKYNIEIDEVKSTVLAFATDLENRRFILIHLGDGCIGVQSGDQKRIVSYPVNGVNRYYTMLTNTVPVADSIQVKSGVMDDKISAVYLLSDGWCEDCENNEHCEHFEHILAKVTEPLSTGTNSVQYSDDVGVIAMIAR